MITDNFLKTEHYTHIKDLMGRPITIVVRMFVCLALESRFESGKSMDVRPPPSPVLSFSATLVKGLSLSASLGVHAEEKSNELSTAENEIGSLMIKMVR